MPPAHEALARYREKRDFERTREPEGKQLDSAGNSYCVQQHAATRLHYDFRLELDGVLKSWAIPKGPSMVPGQRRLAVATEDHPTEYGSFEGVIPEGEYGGGTVLLWDRGRWEPVGDPHRGLAKGKLDFVLHGDKLRGKFALVRLKDDETQWLLLKATDEHAATSGEVVADEPLSVATELDIGEIAATQGATPKQLKKAKEIARTLAPKRAAKTAKTAKAPTTRAAKTRVAKKSPTVRRSAKKTAAAKKESDPAPESGSDPFPEFIPVQLATLVDHVPTGDDWVHEIKLDGYRVQCRKDGDDVRLSSRNKLDWTANVPELALAVRALEVRTAILDGELCWLDDRGRPVFSGLVDALNRKHGRGLIYHAFDLLYADGRDLRREPLLTRKLALQRICASAAPNIRYTDHVVGRGDAFLGAACEHGLEGIVSKRASAPHRDGRGKDWLKIKCGRRQELVIVGYTAPTHAADHFGSLVLAVHEDDALIYAGRVGTGFDRAGRDALHARLAPLEIDRCPLRTRPRAPGLTRVQWVKPQLVAEVAFSEWTKDGRLRHPSFLGLREDKPAKDVRREVPSPESDVTAPRARRRTEPPREAKAKRGPDSTDDTRPAGVAISNPDKVLIADAGITKLAIAQYYAAIATTILPHLRARPLMLLRCPDGSGKPCFYQKHAGQGVPRGVTPFELREDDGETAIYLAVDTAEGLVATVQMGALELHVWGSRRDDIERPDRLVLDLDPDPSVGFDVVVATALELRDRLADANLESFVMSTGGKGLHVVAPIDPVDDFERLKGWTRDLALALVKSDPRRYTANASKAKRHGKIFIDYLRNGRGATAICPYSTRARPGGPVALPLEWEELGSLREAPRFDLAAVRERISTREDPWIGYHAVRQRL